MDDWLILSDSAPAAAQDGEAQRLAKGLFALEYQLPLSGPTVLIDHRAADAGHFTFSVLHDPEAGLFLLLRQNGVQNRLVLPGPLLSPAGLARLALHFDAGGSGAWLMRLALPGSAQPRDAEGIGFQGFDLGSFDELAHGAGGSRRHGSVQWFGLSRAVAMPSPRAWLGRNTPIATLRGPVAAEALQAGDRVLDQDGVAHEILRLGRADVPSRGSFAPVLLRSPFFGSRIDLLVSSDQLVLVGGAVVEYMCGSEEVLLRARTLVNGRAAMLDNRRASTLGISIDCGAPVILPVDGVGLLAPTDRTGARMPRRVLADFEALPLVPLIEAGGTRRAG